MKIGPLQLTSRPRSHDEWIPLSIRSKKQRVNILLLDGSGLLGWYVRLGKRVAWNRGDWPPQAVWIVNVKRGTEVDFSSEGRQSWRGY